MVHFDNPPVVCKQSVNEIVDSVMSFQVMRNRPMSFVQHLAVIKLPSACEQPWRDTRSGFAI